MERAAEDLATLRRRAQKMLAEYYAEGGHALGEADCLVELKLLEEENRMREFNTGASRDTDKGKLDYEGFLSPIALRRFAEYMNKNRHMKDGSLRDSDNWQRGIPLDVYVKSAWRHQHDWWTIHRGYKATDLNGNRIDLEEALCAVLFNVQGYLHELLKAKMGKPADIKTMSAPPDRPPLTEGFSDDDKRFFDSLASSPKGGMCCCVACAKKRLQRYEPGQRRKK